MTDLSPSDYFYSVVDPDPHASPENDNMNLHSVVFVEKTFFSEIGEVGKDPDYELESLLVDALSSDWCFSDMNQCNSWLVENDLTEKGMIDYLERAGFRSSPEFDQVTGGRSKTVSAQQALPKDQKIKVSKI